MKLKTLILRLLGVNKEPHEESQVKFVSRLRAEDVSSAVERVLGRRLLVSERTAFDIGWRPQGLLSAEDSYAFRVASPNYKGLAALVYVSALAADGYGRDDEKTLELVESSIVTLENAGVNTPVEFLD